MTRATRSHRRSTEITVQIVKRFLLPFFSRFLENTRRNTEFQLETHRVIFPARGRTVCPFYIQVKRQRIDLAKLIPRFRENHPSLWNSFVKEQIK